MADADAEADARTVADGAAVSSTDAAAGPSSTVAAADPSFRVQAAMVAVSVNMRFVGSDPPPPEGALSEEMSSIEEALHRHLKRQEAAISGAATEAMTEMPDAVAEARVMQGSIEVLVVISFALGLLRSYNDVFDAVETATRNTRRIVERLADAFLARPSQNGPVTQDWHAATTASWWLAPAALAAAREPAVPAPAAAAAARPTSRTQLLPAIDFRTVVLWVVGVITFLTALYVAASILLELFAD